MTYAFLVRMLASLLRGELHVSRLFHLLLTAVRRFFGLIRHASPPPETSTEALEGNTCDQDVPLAPQHTRCGNEDVTPSIVSLPNVMQSSLPRSQEHDNSSPLRLEGGIQNDTLGCLPLVGSDVEPQFLPAVVENGPSRSPSSLPPMCPKPALVSQTLIPILPTQSDRTRRNYPM